MTDLPSAKDIERISYDILKGSKAWGFFPTPVDSIVDYSELIINKSVDISSVHERYLHKATDALFKALSKVRGLFDRTQKTIYLDLSQLPSRRNFVKLHETGHGVLPWQQKVYEVIEDDDDSLSASVNEEFEAEANYFASITLFQHDIFVSELMKLNLGIESAMHLAKHFGASVHATLRRYVELSAKRCALLVLEKVTAIGEVPKCFKRDFFMSKRFFLEFGEVQFPSEFGYTWEFTKDYYFGKKGIISGYMTLETNDGLCDFRYQFFNNSYNGFVFIYPNGESRLKSRTKIIVTEMPR